MQKNLNISEKDERTLEKVYRSAVAGLYARLKSNYDFIYRSYGEDGIKLIADMSREYGCTIAERARNNLKNNDIDSITRYILRIFDTVSRGTTDEMKICRENNDRVIIRVTNCPLHFTEPRMCLAHTEMEKMVVEKLNPDLRYRIGRSIPAGDAYCEHIIESRLTEL